MDIKRVYFVGIGGIGMSAIARHYIKCGVEVAGYDRTRSRLTDELTAEGAAVSYVDDVQQAIPDAFRKADETLVVYTPAVPQTSAVMQYFAEKNYTMCKRAEALGQLTSTGKTLCVAGTHGKTTTSTLTAHILRRSEAGCTAFLGGISVNYATNYWHNADSQNMVTEADEYDRSFLKLSPWAAAITAMDADHLDIYGTHAKLIEAFLQFAALVRRGGLLVVRRGLPIGREDVQEGVRIVSYAASDCSADYYAENIRVADGRYIFDAVTPSETIKNITLGLPGRHNIENCMAAIALAQEAGATADEIREACSDFAGSKRRFEIAGRGQDVIVVDDYAHHPQEIRATLSSVREMYPKAMVAVAFQPHLYSRTRDLADDFAMALSKADRLWLLPIYPAREEPIAGVSSEMIAKKIADGAEVSVLKDKTLLPETMTEFAEQRSGQLVLVIMGAGNIDRLVEPTCQALRAKNILS